MAAIDYRSKHTFIFRDGTAIPGFEWCILGWWTRRFPETGMRNCIINMLEFTPEAIEAAGIQLEPERIASESSATPLPKVPFASVRVAVMCGNIRVAVARSRSMAKRIVNALNRYEPDERGQ